VFPKPPAPGVAGEKQDVALLDSSLFQRGQARGDKPFPQSLFAVFLGDR
jgi:hypothetical protein